MTWTYNQGIILSGLSGLFKFTGDDELIVIAQKLIDSVLASYLVPTESGVLWKVVILSEHVIKISGCSKEFSSSIWGTSYKIRWKWRT